MVSRFLLIAGGAIFSILGLLHVIYSILDIYKPKYLAPMNTTMISQMASTGLRLARGRTNMWDAWLGFNISHGLGVVIFGMICIAAGVFSNTLVLPKAMLLIPTLIGVIYLVLAVRFWFRVPAIGIAIGTGLLFMGWVLY